MDHEKPSLSETIDRSMCLTCKQLHRYITVTRYSYCNKHREKVIILVIVVNSPTSE